ncbi:MAG: hemerythrin domain-containing protein [Tissierellia bacterium]|nr:hemerythrin domain-containing protein [Tissierellia bacterium]
MGDNYSVDVLMEEHRNILQLTKVMKSMAIFLMEDRKVHPLDLREIIEFIRNYSDEHHHGKEEKILFQMMVDEIGGPAEKLVRNGMIVEHELARMYVMDLEESLERLEKNHCPENRLEVIGHLMEYANLLQKHAEKEDTVVYPFALRSLSREILEQADEETKAFEKAHGHRRDKFLKKLQDLEEKYCQ